jgi:hypothetical protein
MTSPWHDRIVYLFGDVHVLGDNQAVSDPGAVPVGLLFRKLTQLLSNRIDIFIEGANVDHVKVADYHPKLEGKEMPIRLLRQNFATAMSIAHSKLDDVVNKKNILMNMTFLSICMIPGRVVACRIEISFLKTQWVLAVVHVKLNYCRLANFRSASNFTRFCFACSISLTILA